MFIVAAFYNFAPLEVPDALRQPLLEVCRNAGVRGTLLLASEGINGTIAGSREGIDAVLDHIRTFPGCADLDCKFSQAGAPPFRRMKVRLKREIVTMRQTGVDPLGAVGTYVAPEDWNGLISSPDVVLIDTRNDYEVAIGSFEDAVDPHTRSFSEFPGWWKENAKRFEGKRIAMFCTGGIRCEKSTSWLMGQGVEDVYHLKGGILKYLATVPETDSLWRGACFVFDERVSVGHGLSVGNLSLCHGCRRPVTPEDRMHPEFEEGVSCRNCITERSDADRARSRERQRQFALARPNAGNSGP